MSRCGVTHASNPLRAMLAQRFCKLRLRCREIGSARALPNFFVVAECASSAEITCENGPIAQRLEQGTHNPLVPGSNPGGPNRFRISDSRLRKGGTESKIRLRPVGFISPRQFSRGSSLRRKYPGKKIISLGNPLTDSASITIMRGAEEIHPEKAH